MMSRYTSALAALCVIAGAGVLELKHSVAAMRDQLARVEADIADEERQVRMLQADWAHVTRPDRLVELAHELGMVRAWVQHVIKLDHVSHRTSLQMAEYRVKIPLSEGAEGVLRIKPPATLSVDWDDAQ